MINNALAIAATISGIVVSLAFFPQAYRIVKNKSSADVSLTTILMVGISIFIWLLYGISINNYPIIISDTIGLLGIIIVLIVYFKYRRRRR